MKALRRLEDVLFRAERVLVCVLLGVLVLLAFLQVVLRQFSIGFVWADTLIRNLVLAAGFVGATVAAREEKHFAVDAMARMLPADAHRWVAQSGRLIGAVSSAFLCCASWQFFLGEWRSGNVALTIGALRIPSGTFEAVLPVAFALMAFHFAMRLGEPPKEEAHG